MILLSALLLAQCQIMAAPIPMEVVRQRLEIKDPPVGIWVITNTCPEMSREQMNIEIASQAQREGKESPLFLVTATMVQDTLQRKSGGKWKTAGRAATYAASAIASYATKDPRLALGGLAFDFITRGSQARSPQLLDVPMEMPLVIKQGTLLVWSAKMRKPQVIGPFSPTVKESWTVRTSKDSLPVVPGYTFPPLTPVRVEDVPISGIGSLILPWPACKAGECSGYTEWSRNYVQENGSNMTYPAAVKRDPDGKISRSESAKNAFKRDNPCPANGNRRGACPGYVIDHIVPLACGGLDGPANMQWQTVFDGKAKDKWETRQAPINPMPWSHLCPNTKTKRAKSSFKRFFQRGDKK